MDFNTLTKEELIEEVKRLTTENNKIRQEQTDSIKKIKILIAKLSHELKTPLNSIIGFGELFKFKTNDTKLITYADNILKSSNYMLSLITDIFEISKSQEIKLSYSIFNTKDCITDIIEGFHGTEIKYTLSDITICADYTRFKQLVYNLISNAIKYNNKDNINIITYITNKDFCFEITNKGEIIKEKDKNTIFELFSQVSSDDNKRQLGSGIGLALCKLIADAHDGEIMLLSSDKNKTIFLFKIPIDKRYD